jgi:hypothetical protein
MAISISDSEFYIAEEKGSFDTEETILKECYASEFSDYSINDDVLAYAVTILLRYFDQYDEGIISNTRFNKLVYMLNQELLKENIDIQLPYFWYLYGPVIPVNFLPDGLIKYLNKPWGRGVKVAEQRRYKIHEAIRVRIDATANNIYSKYGQLDPKIVTGKVIHDVYKIAPFAFQRKYKTFQSQVTRKIKDREILLKLGSLSGESDIKNLNELVRAYDRKGIPEVYSDLLQWKLLIKYQLKHLLSINNKFFSSLLHSYWYIFCQALKIRCNNNLPASLVISWKNKLPREIENYRIDFMRIEDEFYSNIYRSDKVIDIELYNAYNESVTRKLLE